MLAVFYVIVLEAVVCGLMLNRTLYSRTRHMWQHLPIYVILKAAVCTYVVSLNLLAFVTPLCVLFSLGYALVCFKDGIKRKLLVVFCGILCLLASNVIKLFLLSTLGITQYFKNTPDVLATVTVLCLSILFFCFFTIIFTNILCGVRLVITGGITLVILLLLVFITFIYTYMHMLIPVRFNSLFSGFALFFLLPSVMSLYFGEALTFARKDRYFKGNSVKR